ncbi:MAG: hypothetical protein JWN44_1713 [Myxococcales bacterium]|nr:hypothetical protein [Myxococcales bacterium]
MTWNAKGDDGTQYELTIADGWAKISYSSPPDYHDKLSDNCSIADFVDGKIDSSVTTYFGADILEKARTAARGLLSTNR